MIWRTERMIKKILSNGLNDQSYLAEIKRTTWWILFIPVFCSEKITKHLM